MIIFLAALVVSLLVFAWLIRIVKATVSMAISIAIIVLILQLIFGIGPQQLWQQIVQIAESIRQMVTGK